MKKRIFLVTWESLMLFHEKHTRFSHITDHENNIMRKYSKKLQTTIIRKVRVAGDPQPYWIIENAQY